MELDTNFLILVPITIGLVEVVKRAGLSTRYAPMFAIVVASAMAFFLGGTYDAIAQGIIAGLTASGLFSGVKTSMK
jgi:uncharacterized PurR-regulated membrane protein YhhQ (DUF165 family)